VVLTVRSSSLLGDRLSTYKEYCRSGVTVWMGHAVRSENAALGSSFYYQNFHVTSFRGNV
jgi:hypothetical protein